MYYLELIQRFWDFNHRKSIGSSGISLYLYLLKIGYDNDCYYFKISDGELSKELGLTRKTIKSTKEKLKNSGLIEFQTQNGLPCHYRLMLDYPLHISEAESLKEKVTASTRKIEKKEVLEISPINILESIDSSQHRPISENQHIEKTFSETSQQQNNNNIPSLEEFLEFAKTLESYEPELDFEIQAKYESWKSNDWKNTSDRPINNWKSTLKSTLPYMINLTGNNAFSLNDIPNIKRPKPQNNNQ